MRMLQFLPVGTGLEEGRAAPASEVASGKRRIFGEAGGGCCCLQLHCGSHRHSQTKITPPFTEEGSTEGMDSEFWWGWNSQ